MSRYNFKSIEKKWQKIWEEKQEFTSKLDKTKHETLINVALMLHEEGMKAHDSGNHNLSEDLLNGALRLLDI